MRIKPRLDKLELLVGDCSECGGPPGPDTPMEIRLSEARPDKPRPEPERTYCPRCGLPTEWRIQVRGMEGTGSD
jgi:hypothetical protein